MHERETDRGWVCIHCAQEATDRARRTIHRWATDHHVRTERARGRVYFNLADLIAYEAVVQLGRPPSEDHAEHVST